MPDKSRPAPRHVPIASQNTINCSVSKSGWERRRSSRAEARSDNNAAMPRTKPLILTILDGWGFSPIQQGNAIAAARKPTYDMLLRDFPNSLVHTSGPAVGLPNGQMGNSEVGHLNIGAGRVVRM